MPLLSRRPPMFRELPSPVELEEEVLREWKASAVFQASLSARADAPRFVFYEGPPTANGTPHNGHVLTRVIKDLFPRYKTMRGYRVDRKAGWDTHGLPVEIEVEKELGVRSGGEFRNAREAVVAYGLEKFARKCVDSVFKYTTEWEQLTERVGFWVNLDEAYVTYHRAYVESVWWALSRLFDRGLLYQGHKCVWWWPEGGTALSAHEVGEGYRDVDDPSVTVRFAVKGHESTYILAWTTTPWTLPSNVALAVGPDLDYAWVRTEDGQVLIAAEALKPEGEVLKTCKGRELVGLEYEPLYDFAKPEGRAYVVLAAEHVTLDAGSGIVHTAPAYGEADFELGKAEGLALIQLVGSDGHFATDGLPDWLAGTYFKAADKPIMADLTERGLMFHRGTVRHSYPFSPRSKDDPLLQLARPGWFIKTTEFKDAVMANNRAVNWMPEHIKEGRFGDFLRNNVDWALSRERFWGTPLPIWRCAACDAMEAFSSMQALRDRGAQGIAEDVDEHLQIHKPWVDQITVGCKHCSGTMERVPEVIDCWFDSGCMPFAQWGFPHRGVDEFRNAFPADFISEAVDQTRGWFYSLMMISTMLFDADTLAEFGLTDPGLPHPYRNCIVLGMVGDMTGKKESKSVGNYTSPNLVLRGRMQMSVVADPTLDPGTIGMGEMAVRSIDLGKDEKLSLAVAELDGPRLPVEVKAVSTSYGKETIGVHPDDIASLGLSGKCWVHAPFKPPGADAFRWLFYASNPPWTDTRLSLRAIREGQREFHLRLGNVYSFFAIYANIEGFDPTTADPAARSSSNVLDRWIRAEFADTVNLVTDHLDRYALFEAARAITAFVDGLSNWYLRRSRPRFWSGGVDNQSALWTLYDVLVGLSKLIAPFVPFMAEGLYLRLTGGSESVHLQDWPSEPLPDATARELQARMALVREIASLGLSARSSVGVRVRQPLRAAEVVLADDARRAGLSDLMFLLEEELNVREVRFSERAEEFVEFQVKPNFKALGARLGKEMKLCAQAVQKADPAHVRAQAMGDGFVVELPSGPVTLTDAEIQVTVKPREHFQAAGSANAVVALHADLDDDLREEGLSRELVNRIQTARKDLQLGYTDRIAVKVYGDDAIVSAAQRFAEHISKEVLATDFVAQPLSGTPTGEVDDHPFSLAVERVS
ncbi:MAG: isoleucine--tRNA ligase [Myxococcota bacterium]